MFPPLINSIICSFCMFSLSFHVMSQLKSCMWVRDKFHFIAEERKNIVAIENWINNIKWIECEMKGYFLIIIFSVSLPHCMLNWILSNWIFLVSLSVSWEEAGRWNRKVSRLFMFFSSPEIRHCEPFFILVEWSTVVKFDKFSLVFFFTFWINRIEIYTVELARVGDKRLTLHQEKHKYRQHPWNENILH